MFGVANSLGGPACSAVLSTVFLKGSIVGKFAYLLFLLVHTVCVLFFVKQNPTRLREKKWSVLSGFEIAKSSRPKAILCTAPAVLRLYSPKGLILGV